MNTFKPVQVCFVCLGNICRSPLAQGVFETLVAREGLSGKIQARSAGMGNWHVGKLPDPRMMATARNKGVILKSRARQFARGDFDRFDLVLAMDKSNLIALESLCPDPVPEEKLRLFRSFDPANGGDLEVPDPYYGGIRGFELVFDIVARTCPKILEYLKTRYSLTS
jgi:protein-tyrosine phosphatase